MKIQYILYIGGEKMIKYRIKYYDNNDIIMSYDLKEQYEKDKSEIIEEFTKKCSIAPTQIVSINKIEE